MPSINDESSWHLWKEDDKTLVEMLEAGVKPRYARNSDEFHLIRTIWEPLAKQTSDAALKAASQDVEFRELPITRHDGTVARNLLYRPRRPAPGGGPLLVLFHGGGYCLGSPEMESMNCINAAKALGCVAISVDYRLSPDVKFPMGLLDCWEMLQWAAAHAEELGADPRKGFIVGGTSAGGNAALAASHLAVERNLSPPLTGVYLNAAAILDERSTPERFAFLMNTRRHPTTESYIRKTLVSKTDFEAASQPDYASPLWSPGSWPSGHAGQPATYIQISGLDYLFDQNLVYERELREDYGIPTKIHIYSGLPHIFWMNFPDHPVSASYETDTLEGITWLLERQ